MGWGSRHRDGGRRERIVIEKVVRKWKLGDPAAEKADLQYWLSRSPEERLAAVEELRRRFYGYPTRLQRVARVIQRAQH